jgi:LysR family transcriptional regulator, transcription activator of glutamate synthase operon
MQNFTYKNNRLQQLRGFFATIRSGGVTSGARSINLSPSAISKQISTLERDLGFELFSYTKDSMQLTKKGLQFYRHAVSAFNAIESLYEKFNDKIEERKNKCVSIAGHHSVFSLVLPKHLKTIYKEFNEPKIELLYTTKDDAFTKLAKHEIDFAMYPMEADEIISNDLKIIKVMPYNPVCIMPKGHPLSKKQDNEITFKDISKYNYLHTANYAISQIQKERVSHGILKSNVTIENGSWEILRELVKQGLGITIMHDGYVTQDKDIDIRKVYHLSPSIEYCILVRKGEMIKGISERLISLMMLEKND